jgi:oligoribonuclease NrnB/cAMP/cGMP phosphodiesterase (DHH superfamily)
MICFYHKADLDGRCSGAIVKHFFPNCTLVGVDYNNPLDRTLIRDSRRVWVVDFSFTRKEMVFLSNNYDLIWIDHHASALRKMDGVPRNGTQIVGDTPEHSVSACEQTWAYIAGPADPYPKAVQLLGRYDVWDHRDEEVLPFQYGMRLTDTDPHVELWKDLFESNRDVDGIIGRGRTVLEYERQTNIVYMRGMHYEAEFEGHPVIVANKPYSNSTVFDGFYNPGKHDFMILFGVKPGEIKYTLYCVKPEIDVSKIAEKYGGGGHPGAAGFYSKTLIV